MINFCIATIDIFTTKNFRFMVPIMQAHSTLTTFTRFTQNITVGSILALYGSTMHLATLKPYLYACSYTIWPDRAMVIWRIFLLSVSTPLKIENAPGIMDHFSGKFLYEHVV